MSSMDNQLQTLSATRALKLDRHGFKTYIRRQSMEMNAALRNAIFLTGESQRAIALKARIPEARLSAIIRGRIEPTKREKRRLAFVLGVDIDQLFAESAVAP